MAESEPTRYAESKVIPPPRTDIKYPDVAVIPPGGKSVVVVPKTEEELKTQTPPEVIVRHDVVRGEPVPQ